MWEFLYAVAQLVSVLLLIAGFGLVAWYGGWHWPDDRGDD